MLKIDIKKQLNGIEGEMNLNIKLDIKKGDFLAIAGESGGGKTTLLRVIAGLEKADGDILFNNQIWLDKNYFLPIQKRNIGFIFQDYALFPNMTIQENLLFANKDKELANYLLNITQLTNLKDRFPNKLSGGQKQRVSLCRAFMNKPKLLLMDEPLSALNPDMRLNLQQEILLLHKEFNTTTIIVSHDSNEIYRLASRVIVIENGKIIKDGTPNKILFKNNDKNISLQGEVLDIKKNSNNVSSVAIISIDRQLIEIELKEEQDKKIKIGDLVTLNLTTFNHFHK
jgi:molybdate transport system ATP-binding protein